MGPDLENLGMRISLFLVTQYLGDIASWLLMRFEKTSNGPNYSHTIPSVFYFL